MVFQEEGAVQKVLDTTPHTIDGRQVDTKKAIPHAIHQVSSEQHTRDMHLHCQSVLVTVTSFKIFRVVPTFLEIQSWKTHTRFTSAHTA